MKKQKESILSDKDSLIIKFITKTFTALTVAIIEAMFLASFFMLAVMAVLLEKYPHAIILALIMIIYYFLTRTRM